MASKLEIKGKSIQPLPTRDAVLPVIVVLSQLQKSTVSQLVNTLPKRFTASDRIKDFPREKSLELITNIAKEPLMWLPKLLLNNKLTATDETDGFRMTFDDGSIVHLRPSGNAPELRCYAECDSQNQADKLALTTLKQIQKL